MIDIGKIRKCSHLLPDPGGEVVRELLDEIERLRALHAEIVGELYGQGFEVIGWHDNGDAEELDNWFKTNGWCEPDKWTLPKAAEAAGGNDGISDA